MKITHRCSQLSLSTSLRNGAAALLAVLVFALPVASNAQDTTSAIRGKIQDIAGNAVANASVVVQDMRSGAQRSITANDDGVFLAARLLPGGPYKVTVEGTKTVEVPSIAVGDTYNLTINLQSDVAIEEIVTIGQTAALVEVASGPSATFNLADIEGSVAFSRDIVDVYGIDPRVNIDNEEDGFGVNCAGKHPRFNNVTLDGVSQTDRFGLNENGYSTAVGMPFPFDAIEQIAVELAPFDVTYGSFSACNINSVTKAGTNDWEAKAFYEYSSNDLRGDRVADDPTDYSRSSYDKTYIGFNVGGPIIRDRLFFHAAYEESDTPRFLARGYVGSNNGEEVSWLSQADFERIERVASTVYQYETGGLPVDGEQVDEKYLVRVDWNINDSHNAALIYNYYDGSQGRASDFGNSRFALQNHGYRKGAESETTTIKLNSQWTDSLSTEIFYSSNEMNDSQVTIGPKDFGEFQIEIAGGDTVYLGADDSRQANKLDTKSDYFKLQAQYLAGDHIITAGYEREDLEIFNIFVQHSNGGEYRFFNDGENNDPACAALTPTQRINWTPVADTDGDTGNDVCEPTGLDKYELGYPDRIYYGSGGGTNNPLDAAANFTNSLNSLYVQDEIFIDHANLTITAGLRYEWFTSDDRPVFNQVFTDLNNGLRNDANIDGLDLLMPRIGFNWDATPDVTVRGGIGLYSGGNPNVWISNAWSNDGLSNAQQQFRYSTPGDPSPRYDVGSVLQTSPDAIPLSGDGRPGYDVPQAMVDAVLNTTPADANDSFLSIIDPNYKQPREWKYALGATWNMPWSDIQLDVDWLHTRGKNPAYYVDLSQDQIGTTTAGTPIYDYVRGRDNFMLTNSNETPVANVFSLVAQKSFDELGIDLLLGYAYSDAEDVVPMTSSTAGSNFDNVALLDIVNPTAAGSNYVVPHRFTLRFDWSRAFFGDALTRVTLFGYVYEGQPQSYVMSGSDLEGDGFFGRHLLYVPTGPSDPNVVFDSGFDQAAFFQWVQDNGLSSGFQERNGQNASWNNRVDLRLSQEIPLPADLKGRLYFKVYNLGNMLNDDWGKVTDATFFSPRVVDASVDSSGRFVFEDFSDRSIEEVYPNRSLWEARLGIDIRFGQ